MRQFYFEGVEIYLMSRHSAGHKVPPHQVNYRGMAVALNQLGVKFCLSTAAVGSLRPEWIPGTLVICDDFIDMTFRNQTLFERTVYHQDFSKPFAPTIRNAMLKAAKEMKIEVQEKGCYLGGNGPRYESPAEIEAYTLLKADLVGMTATTEVIAMGEAKVLYGCLAIVTNLACGIVDAALDHSEVVDQMKISGKTAVNLLLKTAFELSDA